jgi:hypothetical protein
MLMQMRPEINVRFRIWRATMTGQVFAAPMTVLYLLSIGIAWLAAPRHTAA